MAQKLQNDTVYQEILKFLESTNAKSAFRSDSAEIKRMYFLYNTWYGAFESNYTCSLCAGRIYKRLDQLKKKYGKEYKKV